ncbi:MAG TPA: hypothetical protein DIW31_02630 [Bacteroidales bacterium]|nr:hypothetical protein [Bacteroidales bacterium]
MKRFSANYIFPVNGHPIKNGIVVVNDNNIIVDVIDPKGDVLELESMEFHNGVIVPGFVNAHCHIELSHLKKKLDNSAEGIAGFVSQIRTLRASTEFEIQKSIKQALSALDDNGTVAVGDICNTTDSFLLKQTSKIYFHSFIEVFGLLPSEAELRYQNAKSLLNDALLVNKSSSLTPHATYSISDKLWNFISNELSKTESTVSIHYGESMQEYAFLKDRTGVLAENFKDLGIADGIASNTTPFEIVKKYLPKQNPTLFIHNTFVQRDEIKSIMSHFKSPFFVLCPSSNLFIEGKLPNVPLFIEEGACLAIGTDSFASSNTLSVFDQILILLERFPILTFNEVNRWATLNGAKALNIESVFGSFEKGKKPGLNLITNFDFGQMRPMAQSRVKRLI